MFKNRFNIYERRIWSPVCVLLSVLFFMSLFQCILSKYLILFLYLIWISAVLEELDKQPNHFQTLTFYLTSFGLERPVERASLQFDTSYFESTGTVFGSEPAFLGSSFSLFSRAATVKCVSYLPNHKFYHGSVNVCVRKFFLIHLFFLFTSRHWQLSMSITVANR